MMDLGSLTGDRKLLRDGLRRLKKIEQTNPGDAAYNIARCYSLLRDSKEALRWLGKAIKFDTTDKALANGDEAFDNIRNLPEFKKLVKKSPAKRKKRKKPN